MDFFRAHLEQQNFSSPTSSYRCLKGREILSHIAIPAIETDRQNAPGAVRSFFLKSVTFEDAQSTYFENTLEGL